MDYKSQPVQIFLWRLRLIEVVIFVINPTMPESTVESIADFCAPSPRNAPRKAERQGPTMKKPCKTYATSAKAEGGETAGHLPRSPGRNCVGCV